MIAREPIYAALFGLAAGAGGFVTAARRFRHWSEVTPAEQPALFMRQKSEAGAVKALGAPTVWTLVVELHLYAHQSDPYAAPASVLNPLIDAVEAALAPSPATGVQNLGLPAMVQHAYIAGKIVTDEGVLRDQAVAIIPVEILCLWRHARCGSHRSATSPGFDGGSRRFPRTAGSSAAMTWEGAARLHQEPKSWNETDCAGTARTPTSAAAAHRSPTSSSAGGRTISRARRWRR